MEKSASFRFLLLFVIVPDFSARMFLNTGNFLKSETFVIFTEKKKWYRKNIGIYENIDVEAMQANDT